MDGQNCSDEMIAMRLTDRTALRPTLSSARKLVVIVAARNRVSISAKTVQFLIGLISPRAVGRPVLWSVKNRLAQLCRANWTQVGPGPEFTAYEM
jgi:hypothetical protein